jgi:hypothetical protein
MSETVLTLDRRAPRVEGFAMSFKNHLAEQVELARDALEGPDADAGGVTGPGRSRHVAALEEFQRYVGTLHVHTDQRILALCEAAAALVSPPRFVPGKLAGELLNKLGGEFSPPPPTDTMAELVAAAVSDLAASKSAEEREAQRGLEQARAEAERLRPDAERLPELERELAEARERREHLSAELEESQERADYLRSHLGNGKAKGDWKVVEGHPGVYGKANAAGEKVYRIGVPDPDRPGNTKWRKVGTDLDEAIAARAAVTEPVAA